MILTPTATITNEWVQVVACYNSNKSKIFVNGQKVADKNVNKNYKHY